MRPHFMAIPRKIQSWTPEEGAGEMRVSAVSEKLPAAEGSTTTTPTRVDDNCRTSLQSELQPLLHPLLRL